MTTHSEGREMSEPRTIKKYPNRRLYDTVESRTSRWPTSETGIDRIDFVVIDKKARRTSRAAILLQVIAEQEHGGEPLMSRDFSRRSSAPTAVAAGMIGSYLEQSVKLFVSQQRSAQRGKTDARHARRTGKLSTVTGRWFSGDRRSTRM